MKNKSTGTVHNKYFICPTRRKLTVIITINPTYKVQLLQTAALVRVWGRRTGLVGGREVGGRRAFRQQVLQFRGIPSLRGGQAQLYNTEINHKPARNSGTVIFRILGSMPIGFFQ